MPHICIVPLPGRLSRHVGMGRPVGRRDAERLDAGFLVIRQPDGRSALRIEGELDLVVDVHHFRVKVGIATLEVVRHPMGMQVMGREDLGNRSLLDVSGAGVARGFRVFADVARQQGFRPKFWGPAHVCRFLTRQPNHPSASLRGDLWRPTRPRENL